MIPLLLGGAAALLYLNSKKAAAAAPASRTTGELRRLPGAAAVQVAPAPGRVFAADNHPELLAPPPPVPPPPVNWSEWRQPNAGAWRINELGQFDGDLVVAGLAAMRWARDHGAGLKGNGVDTSGQSQRQFTPDGDGNPRQWFQAPDVSSSWGLGPPDDATFPASTTEGPPS